MVSLELDPRLTFDSFVIGTANRLASAAARRVGDAPGSAYNPLFFYSASGLGKTHLLMGIGNHVRRAHPSIHVIYDTLEHLMDAAAQAIERGERDAYRERLREAQVLLLDDVQFLAGRREAQEELLSAWDALSAGGGQVVLASDRPPTEIDDLDRRLLSRFSGGLIADIGPPDYETRVAIVKRKSEERGHTLSSGVAEVLARVAFANVRELQGGLNRVIAAQELDGRSVSAEEVNILLGVAPERRRSEEFSTFFSDVADAVGEIVSRLSPEQRLAEAILRFEGEGFRTHRLEAALPQSLSDEEAAALVERFEQDVERMQAALRDIRQLDPAAPELTRNDVFGNPDRVLEAEALVAQVYERMRPLPEPPDAPALEDLDAGASRFAVRAARAVAEGPGTRYNPFYVHGPRGSGRSVLLASLACEIKARHPRLPLAFVRGGDFASELIEALEHNQVDAWRTRYRRARVLILDDIDALHGTERAQEELFHLFDAVRRANGQLVFSGLRPPRTLDGIDERLRTRLASGLVIDIEFTGEMDAFPSSSADAAARAAHTGAASTTRASEVVDEWFASPEKVLPRWPYIEDLIVMGTE